MRVGSNVWLHMTQIIIANRSVQHSSFLSVRPQKGSVTRLIESHLMLNPTDELHLTCGNNQAEEIN